METKITVSIILNVLILSLGLILILWKSYFTEKGKNIATKEDIEEITKKIEIVKNEVSTNSQRRLIYLEEKKEVALDFLNSISIWLDFTLRPLSLIYNNPINQELLVQIVRDLKEKGANASSSYWKLFVYFNQEKFSKHVDGLYNSCLDLHNLTNKLIIDIERKALLANSEIEYLALVKDNKRGVEINNYLSEMNQEIDNLIEKYVAESKVLNEKVTIHRYQYVALLNSMFKVKIPA